MRTLKHDETLNGDPMIENGQFVFVAGLEAVEEMIRRRVRVMRNEWFLDLDRGVDYKDSINIKAPNFDIVAAEFKAAIADVPGFRFFRSFDVQFTPATRTLNVSFSATFDDGTVDMEV